MYKRINELNKYQQDHKLPNIQLADQIGCNAQTLKNIKAGKPIFKSTVCMVDNFLDNPVDASIDFTRIEQYKQSHPGANDTSIGEMIGISGKTLFNAINAKPISLRTQKLIKNFIEKACI